MNVHMVLFRDGKSCPCEIYIYGGACLNGDPTAYVFRDGRSVWVRPGESVSFVEV